MNLFFETYGDLLQSAGRAAFEGVVAAVVLASLAAAMNWRARRIARAQIRDQILRVLGLRLVQQKGWFGAKGGEFLELPPTSIRGREALARLQWQLDLYRNFVSANEMSVLQGAVESLDRVAANPGSASAYYSKDALPKLAKAFVPRRMRPSLAAYIDSKHWSELLATRADFNRQAEGPQG
jgi:hypothetical protein